MNRQLHHVTVSPRVHSCGRDVVNAHGDVIATARDPWAAAAIAALIEMGRPIAEAEEKAYLEQEARLRRTLFASRAPS